MTVVRKHFKLVSTVMLFNFEGKHGVRRKTWCEKEKKCGKECFLAGPGTVRQQPRCTCAAHGPQVNRTTNRFIGFPAKQCSSDGTVQQQINTKEKHLGNVEAREREKA